MLMTTFDVLDPQIYEVDIAKFQVQINKYPHIPKIEVSQWIEVDDLKLPFLNIDLPRLDINYWLTQLNSCPMNLFNRNYETVSYYK